MTWRNEPNRSATYAHRWSALSVLKKPLYNIQHLHAQSTNKNYFAINTVNSYLLGIQEKNKWFLTHTNEVVSVKYITYTSRWCNVNIWIQVEKH